MTIGYSTTNLIHFLYTMIFVSGIVI